MTPEDCERLISQLDGGGPLPITGIDPEAPTAIDIERNTRHRVVAHGVAIRELAIDARVVEAALRRGLVDIEALQSELWWWRVGLAGLGAVGLALAVLAIVIAVTGAVLR